MKRPVGKPPVLFILLSLFLILSITGCAGTEKKVESSLTLFNKASAYYEKKKYWKARETFQQVRDNYPLSKYSTISELRIADSYYNEGQYSEAVFHYEDFKKLHPTNPVIPYVIYQIGMAYFSQILSVDRDQTLTHKAAKEFKYLISTYPSSTHAVSAQEKLDACKEKLSQHEFYVGYFSFRTKRYSAALNRFNGLLRDFPKSSVTDKTYLYIGKTHLSLGDKEKAGDSLTYLLRNYPDSEYRNEAQALLTQIK